ncbi:MAG: ankyrin repeat domain-containing protein [Rhodocyclaceae bacterium]|nr:ankyrin repeat domain-containing protein [Rhodocyclaceae bacterium]
MKTLEQIFRAVEEVPDFADCRVDAVHYRNGWGHSPLHIVSVWGDCEAIALLVAAGADIDSRGEAGYTALHDAVEQRHELAARLLLSLGASQFPDDAGTLPGELAAMHGRAWVAWVFAEPAP